MWDNKNSHLQEGVTWTCEIIETRTWRVWTDLKCVRTYPPNEDCRILPVGNSWESLLISSLFTILTWGRKVQLTPESPISALFKSPPYICNVLFALFFNPHRQKWMVFRNASLLFVFALFFNPYPNEWSLLEFLIKGKYCPYLLQLWI